MDLARFYDEYRGKASDDVDEKRLKLITDRVGEGEKVLEIGGHIGLLSAKLMEKGAKVTLTDISHVALDRAIKRGVKDVICVDTDTQALPLEDGAFDVVISCSSMEHVFYPEKMIAEAARVLRKGGRFMLMMPNIGHFRMRLWLLMGRFPILIDTPTDELHIRFMTLYEAKKLCKKHGLKTISTDGNAGLWSKDLYPGFLRMKGVRYFYKKLAGIWPSMFARDFIMVCERG
ncbi:class I SAM-dependent methyltransferase [Candidatus Altiarchaeota archaeon]